MGIAEIFQALAPAITLRRLAQGDFHRVHALRYHFQHVSSRFIFCLQELNCLAQDYATAMAEHGTTMQVQAMGHALRAQCMADSTLSYLGMLVDDVAMLVAFAADEDVDSMGKLLGHTHSAAFAFMLPLLEACQQPESWWHLAFKRSLGARQLLVHHQHLVQIQCAGNDSGLTTSAFLCSPLSSNFAFQNYFALMLQILSRLFAWLDELERVLAQQIGVGPSETCFSIPIPVGHVFNFILDERYFPVPLCHASAPLPVAFQATFYPDEGS